MADEDFIINIQPTPNFVVELNEQGPQGPRGPQGVQGIQGEKGEKGDKGDTGELSIGTVTTGEAGSQASVVNVGTSTDAILDFVIPRGDQGIQGPPNELAIGTVEKGEDASASITGSSPNQKLNLVLPKGDKGDVGPAGTIPVGTIFSHTCSSTFVPENSLPCNGIEYSQTQFPALWTDWLVGGRLNTCTYSQYQSDIDTYGKCGKWGLDTENGKFKTPYIPDGTHIQQAMTDGELGKSYNAGLPKVYLGEGILGRAGFDARRSNGIFGLSDTVQTAAVSLRYFVVVATGSINQSEMDWSAWASSLEGRLDKNHSNDTKPYIDETYVNGTSGYIVYSNGLCEQWGRFSAGVTNIYFLKSYINANYVITYMQNGAASATIERVGLAYLYKDSFTVNIIRADMVPACWRSLGYIL